MTNNAAPHMNLTDWVLLVALSIVWGGSFLFIGIAVKELPPFTIVLLSVNVTTAAHISTMPRRRSRRVRSEGGSWGFMPPAL